MKPRAKPERIRPQFLAATALIICIALLFGRHLVRSHRMNPNAQTSASGPVFLAAQLPEKSEPRLVDQYADLRRIDRYEHLKKQRALRRKAELVIELNRNSRLPGVLGNNGPTPAANSVVEIERARNLKSYAALLDIVDRLLAAKSNDDYDALAIEEEAILEQIKADRLEDYNDLARIKRQQPDYLAKAFETIQRYRSGE
jgi:hypothetical protein